MSAVAAGTIEGAPFAPPDPDALCVRPTLDWSGSGEPAMRWVLCAVNGQTGTTGDFSDLLMAVGKVIAAGKE
jgi:hypothetical protein